MRDTVLVHLAAGIGNIVLATPLLIALHRLGVSVDLWLSADYGKRADLFRGSALVRGLVDSADGDYTARIPAVPTVYWHRYNRLYDRLPNVVRRPADRLFWIDEQAYDVEFAACARLHRRVATPLAAALRRVVDAGFGASRPRAGMKTGEMAAKRWPHSPISRPGFANVVVVGTADDLMRFDGTPMAFPAHVRVIAGRLGLRATAETIAAAGVVVANDSGLGHLAAALGVPTVLIFGPTPHHALGPMPPNVTIVRAGLPCEPCWFTGTRWQACRSRIDCLRAVDVDAVATAVTARMTVAPSISC